MLKSGNKQLATVLTRQLREVLDLRGLYPSDQFALRVFFDEVENFVDHQVRPWVSMTHLKTGYDCVLPGDKGRKDKAVGYTHFLNKVLKEPVLNFTNPITTSKTGAL